MTLSPLISRIAAWSLLAAFCWAVGGFLVVPLLDQIREDRERISHSQMLLNRYRQLEANLPIIQARLRELRGKVGSEKDFLLPAASALMAAELQNATRKAVSAAGAVLRSSRTLAPTSEKSFERVGIELDITASTSALAALLHAVAMAQPIVLIERMLVQVPESGVASKTTDGQVALTASLRLVSYARPVTIGAKP